MIFTLVILVFLFLGVCGLFVVLADGAFGGLDFKSNQAAINQVIGIIKQRHLETGVFYDLGSARGKFALKIAKAFPKLQVSGIDNNSFRLFLSNIRSKFLKNLNFKKEDIFKTDVSSANIIYLYLPKELMPEMENKLQHELKPGAWVITNKVNFPHWLPVEKINDLSIYAKV